MCRELLLAVSSAGTPTQAACGSCTRTMPSSVAGGAAEPVCCTDAAAAATARRGLAAEGPGRTGAAAPLGAAARGSA